MSLRQNKEADFNNEQNNNFLTQKHSSVSVMRQIDNHPIIKLSNITFI